MLKVELENKCGIPIKGIKPGETVRVAAAKDGTPKNSFWRRRIKDGDFVASETSTSTIEEDN